VLRGGARLYDEAKPIGELLKGDGCGSSGGGLFAPRECDKGSDSSMGGLLRKITRVTWLDPVSAPGDGPLKDVYDRYTEATRAAFLAAGAERIKDLKETPFAGAEACTSCHPQQAAVYAKMAHAHAMQTLVSKGKQEDPECVGCHSLGAKEKGGFVSLAASPQFANVQCENCHGPRLAHVKDPKNAPKPALPAAAMCVGCHTPQRSSNFDFATYWAKIQH